MILEYERFSSGSEYSSFKNSRNSSKGSADSKNMWVPSYGSSNIPEFVSHPLPEKPSSIPTSESLPNYLSNTTSGLYTAFENFAVLSNTNFDKENIENISQHKSTFDLGNESELFFGNHHISIPKLRNSQAKGVQYDGELLDSDDDDNNVSNHDLNNQIATLHLNEQQEIPKSADLSRFLNDSVSSVKQISAHQQPSTIPTTTTTKKSPSKIQLQKQMAAEHLQKTLDSAIPLDRSLSTIIRDNHKKYANTKINPHRDLSDNEKYFEDIALASMRQNIQSNMSMDEIIIEENEDQFIDDEDPAGIVSTPATTASRCSSSENKSQQEKEDNANTKKSTPVNLLGTTDSSKYDFTIADYMNNSTTASNLKRKKSFRSQDGQRNVSLESSVPLGESTAIDTSMSSDNKIEKDDEVYMDLRPLPMIPNDGDSAFKPFTDAFLQDKNSEHNDSNNSANSAFTLKLAKFKNSQDKAMDEVVKDIVIDETFEEGHKSLAPSKVTNSVLENLLFKTNEYAAKSGIQVDEKSKPTKIFSNLDMFEKPDLQMFEKPNLPKSPTQDSLSSSKDVHNIWANLEKRSPKKDVDLEKKNEQDQDMHMKASTIRSSSMKSSPSIRSADFKKMLKAKRKVSHSVDRDDCKYKIVNPNKNFIDDSISRADEESEGNSIQMNGEDDIMKEDKEIESEHDDETIDHIQAELMKVPQPLLPEQHLGGASDFEKEFNYELRKNEEFQTKGYRTRGFDDELIVAKLEESDEKNEVFNNKKKHVAKSILEIPGTREIKTSGNRHSSARDEQQRKISGQSSKSVINRKSSNESQKNNTVEKEKKHNDTFGGIVNGTVFDRTLKVPKTRKDVGSRKITNQPSQDKVKKASPYMQHQTAFFDQPQDALDVSLPKDDRGRLYVRIVGLKGLDLEDIDTHKAKFSLVLDNGIHCISTPNIDLDTNTSINQEFELTVGDSLEFILTLKAEYEYEGEEKLVEVVEKYPVKKKIFCGIFGHKTVFRTCKKVVSKIDKTDPWDKKMAQDGSFARAYVDFSQYEPLITGKACNFDITCFNEWEVIDAGSGKSRKKQPYRIGKLELQMLYVPRSKENEIFPPSIQLAYEAVKEYQKQMFVNYEGFLSQEGGDCNYLKRRWFTLNGTELVAHNESSKKTRAKINLIKASALISSNIKKTYGFDEDPATGNNRNTRKLSDEMILQKGFKIKFLNGEIIEFVADSQYEKMNWLRSLDLVISKNKFRQPWVKILYDQLG